MIKRSWKLTLIIFVMLSFNSVVIASENDSESIKETDVMNPEHEAFKKDMKIFKKLMFQNQKEKQTELNVRDVEFEIGDNPVKGLKSARVIVIEFSDYSCHFCARYVKETFPELNSNYINTGKIRYTVIDFPLPNDYVSVKAAEASYCADDQGKFWEMHEAIMHDQKSLNDLNSIASFVDLDINKFEKCLVIKKYNNRVISHISLASRLEIPSVPGFIIASIDKDNPGKVKGMSYIRGAKPFEVFQQEIDKALADLTR